MKNNDANLIQRTLEGDQQAFAACGKIPKTDTCIGMAENW